MTTRDVQDAIAEFADDRDWRQFHTPRNLILAMVSEIGELAELVQWIHDEDVTPEWLDEKRGRLTEEISDVFIYLARLADILAIDLESSALAKIADNANRYPVEASRGNAVKYTDR